MIKVKEMVKVRVTAPKNRIRRVVEALYNLKLVHLVDYRGKEFFQIGEPLEGASDYSSTLVKVTSMVSALKIAGKPQTPKKILPTIKKFKQIHTDHLNINNRLSSLKQEKNLLRQKLDHSKPISALGIKTNLLSGYSSISSFAGTFKPKKDFKSKLAKISPDYELRITPSTPRKAIALFVPSIKEAEVRALLVENGFSESNLSMVSDVNKLERKISDINSEISSLENKITQLKTENSQLLLDLEYTLDAEVDKLEAPLRFATSLNAFYLEGWIPVADARRLQKELSSASNDKIFVELFKDAEGAPIALQNPGPVHPFEFFMNLYSLPKAIEIDPTFFVFLAFPLFFGFMLGDVGYGIATIVAAYLMRNLFGKEWRLLMSVMFFSGAATILFGFVFGEFFGFEFVAHPLLHRTHDVNLMLLIAVLVGAVHVNIGFLIGFYNKLMQHGFKQAFLEKISWMVMELGVVVIALEQLAIVNLAGNGLYIGGAIALVGIAMIYMGEGIKGLIELPAILSNILSYARLFAIGLASVALALIINQFATDFISQGGVMIIAAIVILILGHFINLAIGVLGSFLHSLRLHYVEFFNKFFEGGGIRYIPFGER